MIVDPCYPCCVGSRTECRGPSSIRRAGWTSSRCSFSACRPSLARLCGSRTRRPAFAPGAFDLAGAQSL